MFNLVAQILLTALQIQIANASTSKCQKPFDLDLGNKVYMRFCEIPAAQGVLMGSQNGAANERPVVAKNFKSFQVAQTEVTQLQYFTVTGNRPWDNNKDDKDRSSTYLKKIGDNYPAMYVFFGGINKFFIERLNQIDPTANYRLLTEAEWEYAARGKPVTRYEDLKDTYFEPGQAADFAFYASQPENPVSEVYSCPNRVLQKQNPGYCANDFGLLHMLGNVWELTADTTDEITYHPYTSIFVDGNTIVGGGPKEPLWIMARGGAVHNDIKDLRVSKRGATFVSEGKMNIGLRIARFPK